MATSRPTPQSKTLSSINLLYTFCTICHVASTMCGASQRNALFNGFPPSATEVGPKLGYLLPTPRSHDARQAPTPIGYCAVLCSMVLYFNVIRRNHATRPGMGGRNGGQRRNGVEPVGKAGEEKPQAVREHHTIHVQRGRKEVNHFHPIRAHVGYDVKISRQEQVKAHVTENFILYLSSFHGGA